MASIIAAAITVLLLWESVHHHASTGKRQGATPRTKEEAPNLTLVCGMPNSVR